MKDEWNNECPYDFKNIQFKRPLTDGAYDPENGEDTWVYTFNNAEYQGDIFVHSDLSLNTEEVTCYSNTIKEFGFEANSLWLTDNVFLGISDSYRAMCYHNYLDVSCSDNTFGSGLFEIRFMQYCSGNYIGPDSYQIVFGNEVCDVIIAGYAFFITVGNYSDEITIGENSENIVITDYSSGIDIGDNCICVNAYVCARITIGDDCKFIDIKEYAVDITIKNGSEHITIGSECSDISIEEVCYGITFGYKCSNINVDIDAPTSSSFGASSITVGDYCRDFDIIQSYSGYRMGISAVISPFTSGNRSDVTQLELSIIPSRNAPCVHYYTGDNDYFYSWRDSDIHN